MPRKKAVKKSRKKNHEEVLRRDASDNVINAFEESKIAMSLAYVLT